MQWWQTRLVIGTVAVLPARFRVDRTVGNLYFARKLLAALAKSCNPRPLLERRVIGMCIGSDRAGLVTTNGTTPSASSAKSFVVIIVTQKHELLPRAWASTTNRCYTHMCIDMLYCCRGKMTAQKHPALANIEWIRYKPICRRIRCHSCQWLLQDNTI